MAAAGPDLRTYGDRIEQLLEASAAAGPVARQRAEEMVRLVVELYGAGIERILTVLHAAGALDDAAVEALAADDLVASLLLVHDLHPYGVEDRIERALASVRPYLGTHGGDVELLDVGDTGVVRLRMLGSCDGCPSSSATLTLAVEGAITAAAPEVTAVTVVAEAAPAAVAGVIPVEALTARLRRDSPAGGWEPVGPAESFTVGLRPVTAGGLPLVVCRVGADLFAYRDSCPGCDGRLATGALERPLGSALGTAVLTCPGCRRHFDVRAAGLGLDDEARLDPLPLLVRDGVVEIAVPGLRVPA